jgi:predicted acyltransferase
VNTPGSWAYVYPPLLHAEWHGCTPTDLVFPFFLFIVGVSMCFSFAKFDYRWNLRSVGKLLRRAALIFLIGLLLNAFPFIDTSLSSLRIMGVLQRIGLAFGIGGLMVLIFSGKVKPVIIFTGFILLAYWILLYLAGVDQAFTLENNIVRQVDLFILGEQHLYGGFGIPFDPEGLLSTLPSAGTVLIGFLTGKLIRSQQQHTQKMITLAVLGASLAMLGWFWGLVFPINKPLWTSSYVLFTSGIATLVLGLFYWLIDVKKWKTWSQLFVVYGLNPLFIFVLSAIWVKVLIRFVRFESPDGSFSNGYNWLYESVFVPLGGEMNGSLLFAVFHILVFWLVAFLMHFSKIYIKI